MYLAISEDTDYAHAGQIVNVYASLSESVTLEAISASFMSRYSQNLDETDFDGLLDTMFMNLFGYSQGEIDSLRATEAGANGFAYWVNELQNNQDVININTLAIALLNGAAESDQTRGISSTEFTQLGNQYSRVYGENMLEGQITETPDLGSTDEVADITSFTFTNGYITNTGSSDIIIKDVGLDLSGTVNIDGYAVTMSYGGTFEQGLYFNANANGQIVSETIPGMNLPDITISSDDEYLVPFYDSLPTTEYADYPGASGSFSGEITLITTAGVLTEDINIIL